MTLRPTLRLTAIVAVLGYFALAAPACDGDDRSTQRTTSTPDGGPTPDGGGQPATDGGGDGSLGGGVCDPDPLKTGLVAMQTGVPVDSFDCAILRGTAKHAEPDPMIFKAIIYVESRFDRSSIACPNLPCGTPSGWTEPESRCYGLMQIVPACKGDINATVLLPNGHPNLTTDSTSSDFVGSVFNPDANIDVGIAGIAGNRAQVVKAFPGCTIDQYTLMAIGNYNSYGSTKSCTEYNSAYTDIVLDAYKSYAQAANYPVHAY